MSGRESIWRLRLWVWLPALLFFLANAASFTVYRLGYAGTVEALQRDLKREKEQLAKEQQERRRLEELLGRVDTNRQRIQQLYEQRFSTRRERLTRVNDEVKNLARQAGLSPRSFSYPQEAIDDFDLVKRSYIFSVDGTYPELRRFINLLERSDSFLILEEVTLNQTSDEGDGGLRISLKLSTLFEERGARPRLAGRVGGVS
jgi:type IV pilus assembly protein PilO